MSDLLARLRAALDEDERVALAASGDTWITGTAAGYAYSHPGDVYAIAHDGTPARIAQGTQCGPDISAEQSSDHIARHDPARVLRWVAAAREVLDRHRVIEFTTRHGRTIADCTWCSDKRGDSTEEWPCPDVRALAGVYGIGEAE